MAQGSFNIDEVLRPVSERSLRHLPRLVLGALRLAWDAAPRIVARSVALQVVGGAALAVQVLAGRQLVAALVAGGARRALGGLTSDLVALVLAGAVVTFGSLARWETNQRLSESVARYSMGKVLDVTTDVDLRAYDTPAFHDRLQRAIVNAQTRPMQMTSGFLGLLGSLAGLGGVAVALLVVQPLFFLLVIVAYVPVWVTTFKASRVLYRWTVEQTERERRRLYLQAVLSRKDEAKEVRSYHLGPHLRDRYDRLYDQRISDLNVVTRNRLLAGLAGSTITSCLTGAAVVLLVWMVDTGRISVAGATAAAAALILLGGQLRALATSVGQLYESSLFIEDFNTFVASAPSCPLPESAAADQRRQCPAKLKRLEAQSLAFTYPSRSEPSIKDVSVRIESGEVVALVGENGSGKTTLAKLLAGLYAPAAGRLTWNGIDVRFIDPQSYRDRCTVVFQDFARYQLTASDNIALGRWELGERPDLVKAAAGCAGADPFLAMLPGGYESVLGPEWMGGVDLSGGQWQRVALARAFYRDSPLVVLDEPTAALDPRSEAALFDSVRTLFKGRGVLLISHRFSSVRNADRIYVLDGGRVIEEGTHEALLALDGRYAELYRLQASAFV